MNKSFLTVSLLALPLILLGCDSGNQQAPQEEAVTPAAEAPQTPAETEAPAEVQAEAPAEAPAEAQTPATTQPADGEPEVITTSTGLKYQDLKVGTGEVAEYGDTAVVHYVGTLESGEKFDSSRDRGQPFSFTLGAGRVIAGWEQGVAGMRVGGMRRLIIPAHLAYGERGVPGAIPPNATLNFEIELLELR